MITRIALLSAVLCCMHLTAQAQVRRDGNFGSFNNQMPPDNQPPADNGGSAQRWRTPSSGTRVASDPNGGAPSQLRPVDSSPRQPVAARTEGGSLPNNAGQRWVTYDISPYTARVTSTNNPQQALVDWVLRETGYETWFSEGGGVLHATNRQLLVYHTPEMQNVVGEMVDRFVNTEAESQAFGLRVISMSQPDWRTKAHRLMTPIATQTPGVQAWLLQKENAAYMTKELQQRTLEFREHSTQHLLVNNGQSKIISSLHTRNYPRDVVLRPDMPFPGFAPQTGQINEGFNLEFSPLLSLDGKEVDAVIKCEIDQIEKMVKVNVDVPTGVNPKQQTLIEVPQVVSTRLHERFRWPADQVLLISLAMGPTPVPPGPSKVPGFLSSPPRADLLILVESKGKLGAAATAAQPGVTPASNYRYR